MITINSNNKYISLNGHLINLKTIPKYIETLEDVILNLNTNKINEHQIILKNYYIIHNGKIIDKNTHIANLKHYSNNIINIEIIKRQKGGAGLFDVFDGIIQMAKFFFKIYDIMKWLGNFIVWYVFFMVWLFTDLLNPLHFGNEFFNSLMILVLTICKLPFDILFALLTFSINIVGGWMQGFWGWDQSSLTQLDRDSNYFHKVNQKNGKKCYLTNTNKVPFSIILGTILCPPIGVFMDLGMTGWLNIIICALLTLLFYIPGLTYALLIIYS